MKFFAAIIFSVALIFGIAFVGGAFDKKQQQKKPIETHSILQEQKIEPTKTIKTTKATKEKSKRKKFEAEYIEFSTKQIKDTEQKLDKAIKDIEELMKEHPVPQ